MGDRKGTCPEVSRIYDLAAYGNLITQKDRTEAYRANILRVAHLLDNTETVDYKSCVLTSSSSVLLPNKTYYALSKLAMEQFATQYAKETGKPIVILRPSTIIGRGENPARLVPKLVHSCLTGEKMWFVPYPTHDYLCVEDFIDAMLLVSLQAKELSGRTLNVSSGISLTNEEIKEIVEEVTGKKANVEIVKNARPYDTTNWEVNNWEIRSLGWKPRRTLQETISQMVAAYE